MERHDVLVVGGGISGLAFAWRAARAGHSALVLEGSGELGGCIRSHRGPDGHWFELGAHTVYNSYGGLLGIAEGTGAVRRLVPRGPARARFGLLRGEDCLWLTPPRLLLRFSWLGILASFPSGVLRRKAGATMSEYYGGLVGRRNYERYLGPFLAAVPSQSADGFPASGPGSLFKKRPRRKEFPRSFGFDGGLQTVCEAVGGTAGVTIRTGVEVVRVSRAPGGFELETASGESHAAPVAAVGTPVDVAASLLREGFPELARVLEGVRTVEVESAGVVLPRDRCWMPETAFVVPAGDIFWSAVTRDPFPDPGRRSFTFHFKPGHGSEERRRRMAAVLRVPERELGSPVERRLRVPAPALGHDRLIAGIDRALAGGRLALTGNYFQGLAIEDCVQRSFAEWERVGGTGAGAAGADRGKAG